MRKTTVLFNSFTDRIDANYISPEDIIAGATFFLYRKTPNQKYYQYVCTLSDGEHQVFDYNIVNNQYYHYLVSTEVQTSSGPEYKVYQNRVWNEENQEFDLVFKKVFWDEFIICNIEETEEPNIYKKVGNTWTFKYNMNEESLEQNTNFSSSDTLGKYAKVSVGRKNYESSSISSLLGDIKEYVKYDGVSERKVYEYTEKVDTSNKYSHEVEKLKSWKKFSSDGELKLLRDRKGNAWIIQIVDGSSNNINLLTNSQQTVVNFSWQEVENLDNASIILVGEV